MKTHQRPRHAHRRQLFTGAVVAGALISAAPADGAWPCGPIRLTASDASPNAIFGRSVALDGDTLIVGAENVGAAYVFRWNGAGWTEEARLTLQDGEDADGFGFAVALDGHTALVGAYADDLPAGHDEGSVYVFTRSGTVWTQQDKLTASDARQNDWFGFAVAIDGDTALVGAFLDDRPVAEGQGSAYVFTRSGGDWTEQTKLTAPDAAFGGYFGRSVALEGDTALIGARRNEGPSESNQGLAYVFTRTGATWTEQARLFADDAAPNDEFGRTLALDGDTALIGAPLHDGAAGFDTGSAYVFTRSGSAWTQQAKLTHPDAVAGDVLGASVALDGDTALLGARFSHGAVEPFQGSARVFMRSGLEWTHRAMLLAPNASTNIVFGASIALDGDTALVGAYGYDGAAGDSQGAAYAFRLDPADLNADGQVGGADLGLMLGAWGGSGETDLNGDGTTNGADLGLLLGAWGPCP